MSRIAFGLDRVVSNAAEFIRGRRFGLLANHASLDVHLRFSGEVLAERNPRQLAAIFSPQHGLWGEQQANMIESPHDVHPTLGVPIHSLYAERREPTAEMLDGLELLVVDLQDVGTRVYTFIWTLLLCLKACSKQGIPVLVLDRPNPLEGDRFAGPLLESEYQSFVGLASIPMRHGLTVAEMARLFQHEQEIDVEIDIASLAGWRRSLTWEETGRIWVGPSPNVPTLDSVRMYPGQVLLEGIGLSEGRGTTLPFQLTGIPDIDEQGVATAINTWISEPLCRPTRFIPTFDKFQAESCRGVRWFVGNRRQFDSFRATVISLFAFRDACGERFSWLAPPYEYEQVNMPIDILYGSPKLRHILDQSTPLDRETLDELCQLDCDKWSERIDPFLLYR